ncbi:diguanylate cyclase domain-containing protein [Vibrio salinus]|uniref:diguanylate cyclase domain-containing protein n=1 Tax=Vibrio salinus TaxID=2899784 RepID=UPI001E340C82|nr:diguanylate cyclase [Vibrio salinus]MCE0495725.1 diguanylate cyclase [Vibrio salinus]
MSNIENWNYDGKAVLLVIDSKKENISYLSRVFGRNYRIIYASSGMDAMVRAREQSPDVILLDVNMPDIDSYHICHTLTDDESTHHIPVVLISRKATDGIMNRKSTESVIEKGYQSGAADIIFPPINPLCLQARIRSHVAFKLQTDYINSTTIIDTATGLYNKNKFDDFLNANWRLCMREHRPISLLKLNIDYYQEYCRQYGKDNAQKCLKKIGDLLHKRARRPSDVCSHYNDDEFACLLPFTDLDGAIKVANDVLSGVRELNIEHVGSKIGKYVTTSIGLSSMIPTSWNLEESKLMKDADLALYLCEQNGQNCIAVNA